MSNEDSSSVRSQQPYFAMTQMAKKDLWRMMPVRLPSISFPTTPQNNWCCDCTKCGESCTRCLSHGWFFTICCGYVVVSSLPRFSAVLDFILTLVIYLTSIREQNRPDDMVLSVGQFLKQEFKDYNFSTSVVDVVIISFVRSCILFFCFAFRYQRDGFTTPILISVLVASISSAFLIVKMLLITGPGLSLLLFNLIYVWAILLLFVCVRRRRIQVRPPTMPRTSSDNISVHINKNEGQTDPNYTSLTNDTHPQHRRHSSELSDSSTGSNDVLITREPPPPDAAHSASIVPPQSIIQPQEPELIARRTSQDNNHLTAAGSGGGGGPIDIQDLPQQHLIPVSVDRSDSRDLQFHQGGEPGGPGGGGAYGSVARMNQSPSYGSVPNSEYSSAAERALAEPDSQFVHLDGLNVHYRILQRPDNEKEEKVSQNPDTLAVVLLHGFGGGVFQWRRVWPELSRKCDILLAFDRPGFGLTSKPINNRWEGLNPYKLEFSVNLTLHMMDYFKIDKAVLVGHSTGASIACMTAIKAPERVRGLGLVAHSQGLPKFIRSILKTKLGGPIIMRLVKSEIGDVAIRRAWHDPDSIPEETIRAHKESIKIKNWGKALLEMARVSRPSTHDSQYSEITCPVLMLHGEDDKLVSLAESQRLMRKFENCELVPFDECGHIPHEECPNRFVVELDAFLDKIQKYAYHASIGLFPKDEISEGQEFGDQIESKQQHPNDSSSVDQEQEDTNDIRPQNEEGGLLNDQESNSEKLDENSEESQEQPMQNVVSEIHESDHLVN